MFGCTFGLVHHFERDGWIVDVERMLHIAVVVRFVKLLMDQSKLSLSLRWKLMSDLWEDRSLLDILSTSLLRT